MFILRWIFRDLHIKVIALLVAAIVWFYAVLERTHGTSVQLPVVAGKIPSGMVVASIDTGQVKAQIAGKGRDLLLLRFRHPTFRLDLAGAGAGVSKVKLSQEHWNLPGGIQFLSARPEYVSVDLDQQARRIVKIAVPTRGKPAPGNVVTSVKVLETVYLTGPQEELHLIASVTTDSLSLAGLNAPSERRLRVILPEGNRFRVEPESVSVSIQVEPEETRTFARVNLTVLKPSLRTVIVKPSVAQITISGAAGSVRGLTLQDLSATLKITDTTPKGKHRLPIEITLPSGITLAKCDPTLFDVEVR
jgi:YbbR domain-containing protein